MNSLSCYSVISLLKRITWTSVLNKMRILPFTHFKPSSHKLTKIEKYLKLMH